MSKKATFEFFFNRLVNGYKSVMGKNPEGLDLIKIKQEATQKVTDANKVIPFPYKKSFGQEVDEMIAKGEVNVGTADKTPQYTPSKSQTDFELQEKFRTNNEKAIKAFEERNKKPRTEKYTGGMVDVEPNLSDIGHGSDALMARTRLMSPGSQATTSTGLNYLLAEDNDNIRVPFSKGGDFLKNLFSGVKPDGGITNSILKNKYHPILSSLNTMELYDLLGMIPFEEGGRVGFSKGKGVDLLRRGFLKAAGAAGAGIAGIKTGLLGFGEKAAPVVEKAAEAVSTTAGKVPPYFFKLVEKIKTLGDDTLATKDKAIAKKYKDYTMEEDFAGNIEIIKKSDDVAEDVYMSYKVDEVPVKGKKGSTKVEEYEEFTARPDVDGKMKDIEQGVPDEVVNEGSVFEDNMTEFGMTKKADGGRIGFESGKFVLGKNIYNLLKNNKKIKKAIDNIFGTGDYKYDAEMAAESLVELNPKEFNNMLYDDLPDNVKSEIYGAVIGPIQNNALIASRAKKTANTIDISDPKVAEEFTTFIKETDPEGYKKLEQTVELSNAKRTKGRKDNADGGRIGYSKAGFVIDKTLKGLGYLKELFKKKDYLEEFPRVDIEKLMKGDKPIKLYSGVGDRQANTLKAYKEDAKFFNTTVDKIKKDNFKGQWFTPFKEYASSFGNPRNIKSKMLTTELTPKEIRMAKRYVDKVNTKDKMISTMKMRGMDNPPKYRITTDDNTVIIPRIKLKKLKEEGKINTDYMILDKIKSKLNLAEGGVAGILGE